MYIRGYDLAARAEEYTIGRTESTFDHRPIQIRKCRFEHDQESEFTWIQKHVAKKVLSLLLCTVLRVISRVYSSLLDLGLRLQY
jgi:hypothetical protein